MAKIKMKIENVNITLASPTVATGSLGEMDYKSQTPSKTKVANPEMGNKKKPDEVKNRKLEIEDKAKVEALQNQLIAADNALVIEKNPNGSGFIYKSIDRTTGEVTRVWPREEVATALQALHDVDARGLMLDESA
jgi:uncharacterized FlaG/YvyC family protein